MPGDPNRPRGPESSVSFLLSRVGYSSSRGFKETLEAIGLEPRQFALLRFVGIGEGRSQQALGEELNIPASRVVALVDTLEDRGLLERRPNPRDRRARALYLTSDGRALLRRGIDAAERHEAALVEVLKPQERARLIELLQKIAESQGGPLGVHPGLREGER